MQGLVPRVELASYGGKFPTHLDLEGLGALINESFRQRGLKLIDGYFNPSKPYYPTGLSYLILSVDINKSEEPIVAGLIAAKKEIGDFKFTYYDKIFVHPDYQGNHLMPSLIQNARIMTDKKGNILPSVLRTSDPQISENYGKQSDIVTQVDGYFIHGFGFRDKKTGKPLFDGAEAKFALAAKYVAGLPQTMVPIGKG